MTEGPRVFITHAMNGLAEEGGDLFERLREVSTCEVWSEPGQPTKEALRRAIGGCEGLLCLLTDRIDADLIAAAPQLKVISTVSVGVDHIDTSAARARGIAIGNTPGVLTETTAELAFALLLATSRRLPEADRFVRAGGWTIARRWEPDMLLGRDLAGSTLGIVGLGAIGQAVAARALAFGMRVLGWSRSERAVPGVELVGFDELLGRSDFVSVHVPLTPETRHLFDAETFARMKPGATLINTARGDVVDEAALCAALASGQLSGAGLDVFEREPLAHDSPLLGFEQVVVAPHIGSASIATRRRMAELAIDNLLAGLAGQPLPNSVV